MSKRQGARRRAVLDVRAEMQSTNSLVLNGELILYGVIDPYSMFDDSSIRAIDVMASLGELADQDKVVVRINSPGGSVTEGLAIYNALKAWGKPIEMHIDAMAASIASIIAMAGDDIVMAENASIMVHNPYASVFGDDEDLRAAADEVARTKNIMIAIYASRTGLDEAEIAALMAAETYMSADVAVEKGFADRIDQPMQIAACLKLDKETFAKLLAPPKAANAKGERKPLRTTRPAPAAPAAQPVKEAIMAKETAGAAEITAAHVDAARAQAIKDERERVHTITAAVRAAKLEPAFAEEMIRDGVSIDDARAKIIDKFAEAGKTQEGSGAPGRTQVSITVDSVDKWAKGAQLGLMARMGMKGGEKNEFSAMTLEALARSALDLRNENKGFTDRQAMIGRAFTIVASGPGYNTTSDFGNVLQNVSHVALLKGYTEAEETFDVWTAKGNLSDFRPQNRLDLGLAPALDQIPEGAEYKYGTFGDEGATITLATYGKMFAITRQAIINDSLDQFSKVPERMGRAAKRTIGNLVYAILNGNPTMQDGLALFHASHGNLVSSGGLPPSVATLGSARTSMIRQTDPSGIATGIGIRPKFILVPPELEDSTTVLLKSQYDPTSGAALMKPNAVANFATLIVDNRLTGNPWYLSADPATVDTIEVAYLDGNETPFMDQRVGWSVDGTEFKVRIDAGVKALHWRGLFKNVGA